MLERYVFRAMNRILKRIETHMHGHPIVLRAGNGYHTYNPMAGFILEEMEVSVRFIDPNGKDLTSKYSYYVSSPCSEFWNHSNNFVLSWARSK
jgi:hypothetical protein